MMIRRLVFFLAAFMFSSLTFASEDWVIAAEKFTYKTDSSTSLEAVDAASAQLPSLILESFSYSENRLPSLSELQQRKLNELKVEYSKLVTSFQSEITKRDTLLFTEKNKKTFKKKLKEQKEKIQEIQDKIKENLEATNLLLDEIDSGEGDSEYIANYEKIKLWKDKSDVFINVPQDSTLENYAVSEKINCVISGNITTFGDYALATAKASVFPGNIQVSFVEEIGTLSDIVSIAEGLATQLRSGIISSSSVAVSFSVLPEEANQTAVVVIDEKKIPLSQISADGIYISAGIHSITVESEGFYPKTFSWDFGESGKYVAKVELEPLEFVQLSLDKDTDFNGKVYINGLPVENLPAEIDVSKGKILGEVLISDKGKEIPSYFVIDIPLDKNLEGVNASLKVDSTNISKRIEKRRRSMYNSYSALLVSLIPTLVSYGMYINSYNAWALGYGEQSKAEMWNIISKSTIGISAGLGANFVFQLGRYIKNVNDVLPENIDINEE